MTKPYVKIDLDGKQGNAFEVLGMCQQAARNACWTDEEIESFVDEATSGDYENLLSVARENFEINNGDDPKFATDPEYDDDDESDGWIDTAS